MIKESVLILGLLLFGIEEVYASPVTHYQLQNIVSQCFRNVAFTVWESIAASDYNSSVTIPGTPGPYDDSNKGNIVVFATGTIVLSSSLNKCTQTITNSIQSFKVLINCGSREIPGRRVSSVTLTSAEPAGFPIVSYNKSDLELTYDGLGSRTPELDLIHKVTIQRPALLDATIPLTNLDTNHSTVITVDTQALEQCLREPIKDISVGF